MNWTATITAAAALAASCGSSTPPAVSPPVAAAPAPSPVDAAIDAAAPADASIADQLASAPAWVFRHDDGHDVQTWTLRYGAGLAMVVVEASTGTTRYVGTVTDAGSLTIAVASGPNHLSLTCKPAKLAVAAACGDKAKSKPRLDVLDCFHPDYKAPMSFGAAPGIEYDTRADCAGYHRIAP